MNLTNYLNLQGNVINGKKLRQPDLNLVSKLDAMGIKWRDSVGYITTVDDKNNVLTENPLSGFTDFVDPFISALINWTFTVYPTYDPMKGNAMTYNGTKVALGTYDRVRMLVLSLDSEAYSNFLD